MFKTKEAVKYAIDLKSFKQRVINSYVSLGNVIAS